VPETFIQEMRRYIGFTDDDAALLAALGPKMEPFFPAMADRFYSQIPFHPDAFRVFTGGVTQINRLKQTLQAWGRGLFSGMYGEEYAENRYLIGYRHVRIGLDQKYVISAMGIVRHFLMESLESLFLPGEERQRCLRSLSRILDLDLNLMCDSYFRATMQNLQILNRELERTTADLAEANSVKDEFLAQVSHDLRTPLNSILGFTRLILDGHCKNQDEQNELLRDVFASAKLLLRLVNDLLDISRIESGKLTLHVESVRPRDLLDSTLPLIAVEAASKGLRLVDETLHVSFPSISADETRLRQVFINLLSNAVKFTSVGSVKVRGSAAGRFVRFEVEDTGPGVAPEEREAVFLKFVRGGGPNARRHEGAGLGLAISKRLVELMGGRIGIENPASGQGTLIWFTVPVAATAEPESTAAFRTRSHDESGAA
jgi:signal transduction histidine kinase